MAREKIWCDCRRCGRPTLHAILEDHEQETDPDSYHEKDSWQIIQCQGCTTSAFRHLNVDFEAIQESPDGEIIYPTTESIYPSVIKNHRKLDAYYLIPQLIRKIYTQTLSALSEKAYVLASIGLRAVIEAVCNYLNVSGSTLDKRIDQLYKAGHVSNGDKKRLHAIRFLGNDAAHEIKEPKAKDLRVALDIIEHLLNSVFILEKRAKSLETIVETYEDFLLLVNTCVKSYSSELATSLAGLLGRQSRQVGQKLDEFEGKLIADITAGSITNLKLGPIQKVGNKDVQIFDVQLSTQSDEDLA